MFNMYIHVLCIVVTPRPGLRPALPVTQLRSAILQHLFSSHSGSHGRLPTGASLRYHHIPLPSHASKSAYRMIHRLSPRTPPPLISQRFQPSNPELLPPGQSSSAARSRILLLIHRILFPCVRLQSSSMGSSQRFEH